MATIPYWIRIGTFFFLFSNPIRFWTIFPLYIFHCCKYVFHENLWTRDQFFSKELVKYEFLNLLAQKFGDFSRLRYNSNSHFYFISFVEFSFSNTKIIRCLEIQYWFEKRYFEQEILSLSTFKTISCDYIVALIHFLVKFVLFLLF